MPDNLSLNNINANTIDIDISGGGTGVTLPQGTTTTAGLMSADDKQKVDNSILQGGNTFGADITIGTIDSHILNFETQGATRMFVQNSWIGLHRPLRNNVTQDNSTVDLKTTGTVISRNVADANVPLIVNQANAGATGNIANFQFGGTTVSKVTKDGFLFATRVGVNSTGANPQYLLDINVGSSASATTLAAFSQNGGSLTVNNSTSAANVFNPLIKGNNGNTQSALGIMVIGAGSSTYSTGAILLRAENGSSGAIASGNVLAVQNSTTSLLKMDYNGVVNIVNLAGTGTRMVTTDSDGTLKAALEVTSGTYSPSGTMTPSGSATAHDFTFIRVGNIVTVNGMMDYNGATSGTSIIEIDIPILSTFTINDNLVGVVTGDGLSAASPNYVIGNTGNNTAHINFSSAAGAGRIFIQFQYQVI